MPTEGKESFNPVGKHSQLLSLCGNRAETLRKILKTNPKSSSLDRQPKVLNLARFLLLGARLKSEAPITPPQPLAVPKASASACHRSEAEFCFAEAKQALLRGQLNLGLDLLNQTEALAGPLPQVLLTRVNALRQARLWPEEALRRYLELLNTRLNSADTHLALGFIHLLQDQWLDVWSERDWRWGTDGETTRWYGSARLFRQARPNDWLSVPQSVQESLETLAA